MYELEIRAWRVEEDRRGRNRYKHFFKSGQKFGDFVVGILFERYFIVY